MLLFPKWSTPGELLLAIHSPREGAFYLARSPCMRQCMADGVNDALWELYSSCYLSTDPIQDCTVWEITYLSSQAL